MDVKPDTVGETVNIAFGCQGVGEDCRVPLRFKEFASLDLGIAAGFMGSDRRIYCLVYFQDILVNLQDIIRGVVKTPCPREVIEIASTSLTGVDIEDDGLPYRDGIRIGSGAVSFW